MLFKIFVASVIMMQCFPTNHPVELCCGQCIDASGNGHQVFDMQYGVQEPYSYINYRDIANTGDFVVSTFEMGNSCEPDDILFRHDLVLR